MDWMIVGKGKEVPMRRIQEAVKALRILYEIEKMQSANHISDAVTFLQRHRRSADTKCTISEIGPSFLPQAPYPTQPNSKRKGKKKGLEA